MGNKVKVATLSKNAAANTSLHHVHPTGHAGQEIDSEMDLNYFCQRYYDPEIGRFMELDPLNSLASSPYAYCLNNPLRFTDPTGAAIDYVAKASWYGALFGAGMGNAQSNLSPYTGAGHGFGSWPGSMHSYMMAHPDFYATVFINEYNTQQMWWYARNDYFRETTINGCTQTTTEYFWNPLFMCEGKTTLTEQLGYEVALNCAQAYNLLCDAAADYGPPTVIGVNRASVYDIINEPGLIVNELFWMAVSGGIVKGFGLETNLFSSGNVFKMM